MIRPLEERDIETCRSWYNWYIEHTDISFEETPETPESYRELAERVTAKYPWIVLEENGVLKGFAYLSPFNPRSAYRFTADVTVYLDPKERGKGYGTELMKELEELARKQGIRKLVSLVTDGNEASERLHASCGYAKKTVLEETGYKFGKWIGVAYYMKDLGGAD